MSDVKEEASIQGTEQDFEDAVIGVQLSMAIKMARSHNLKIHLMDLDVCTPIMIKGAVQEAWVKVKTMFDKTGKGLLIFNVLDKKITYQVGGIYAFLLPGSEPVKDTLDPINLVIALNAALQKARAMLENNT